MANRTDGKDRLKQIVLGEDFTHVESSHYTGQIYKHELLGRLSTGLIDQAGSATPTFEGVASDDALASDSDVLEVLRKGAFKAVVAATDAAAVAASAFRIKGSGGSDALVAADRMKPVYATDSMTLEVDPAGNGPKVGYIIKLSTVGGVIEATVLIDADWASAGLDPEDLGGANAPIASQDFDGVDIGERLVMTERFIRRPGIENIDITATAPTQAQMDAIMQANKDFAVAGTNMTSALVTQTADKGGITMTTAGADNDQAILQPRTDPALQGRWNVGFDSRGNVRWSTVINLPVITTVSVKLGLALTNAHDLTTDADQTGLYFDTDNVDTNWRVVRSIAGVDTESDSGIVVAAATKYRVVIAIDSDGLARTYINDVLVDTSAALTDVLTLKPFISMQARSAAALAIDVHHENAAQDIAAT